ncbi:MAG: amino acid adenylation domain-containing protein [Chitinophagaceae bacterium]
MIADLYTRLKKLNINIQSVDGKLDIKAPKGIINNDLLDEIRLHKEDLMQFIDSYKKKREDHSSIPPAPIQPDYPLSSSQRRLWVLSRFADANVAYNIPAVYILEGKLNRVALEYCFVSLIERHEILRTVFRENVLGEVRQIVLGNSAVKFKMDYADLRNEEHINEKINELVHKDSIRPFDLASGPLLRAGLYQTSDDRWILSYVMHHIISDGWSMGILISELMRLYNSCINGEDSPLNELNIQYKDYAVWQQQQLEGDLSTHEAYWLQQFEGEIPVLELAADNARPAVKTYNGGVVKRHINAETTKAIKEMGSEQGATLFMSMLAAVNVLFNKYAGQEDIIIGSPIAGREHADLEGQIGFYVNTLALRTQFSEDDTYAELLETIRQGTLGAYKHQVYPFDALVDKLDLQRDMSRHPLFDVSLVVQNAENAFSNGVHHSGELHAKGYEGPESAVSKFDLGFDFAEAADGMRFSLVYNSDIYHQQTAERLADHFVQLLKAITAEPFVPIRKLNLLSAQERTEVTNLFNDTAALYDESATIVSLFEQQAAQTPDATAVVFEERSMTYSELNELSNQIGDYLRKKYSINREDLAGICLDRNEWMIVSILGILKAGAGYVPIDVRYPQERIDYMISDSGCKAVINEKELLLFLESKDEYSKENLSLVNQPTDVAYVIYTSGTTGNPKGVMIEHKNVVRLLKTDKPLFDFSSSDVWTMFHSYCFDFSVWEMYGALLFGGKLVVIPLAVAQDPAAYLQVVRAEGVTVLNQTPSSFYQVITQELQQPQKDLALRYVIFGGEALSPSRLWEWKNRYPETKLINMYGITETTVHVTYKGITDEEIATDSNSIGRPIPTLSCYVLDKHQELVPVGVAGELYVGGAGVGRGYLNREELTAQRFIESPFKKGERLYRSGDRARVLQNGELEYSGRLDEQVKIRGYRIELGEIESAIRQYEGIESVAVIATAKTEGDRELIAYVVGKGISKQSLRTHLQEKLPSYMVPGYIVEMEVLPLTSNGKLDRKRLPQPSGDDIESEKEYIAPRTAMEEKLAEIWSEVLGIEKEKISVKDNFFELGGHSLKATRLAGLLYRAFDVKVELRELFMRAVMEDQAQLIEKTKRSQFYSIETAPPAESYPLSASQRRLWILSQFEGANAAYNVPGAYMFEGEFDQQALEYSFSMLIERHESLRTVFRQDANDEVRQYILKPDAHAFAISYQDVRNSKTQEQELLAFVEADFVRPFDLGNGPLLRAGLYQLDEHRWVLSYVMHHIISDGWSMGVLIRELLYYYRYHKGRESNLLNDLRIQYKDYSVWQQKQLSGVSLQEHRSYWLEHFSGSLPVLDLPSDQQRPAVKTYNGSITYKQIGTQEHKGIKSLCLQQNATLFMSIVALVNTLLYKYTGQEDIIIGSPVAGREHPDLEEQIGFYANTLALRTQFSGSDSFSELLERVKKMTLGAYEHQVYPFDELVGELQLVRDRSRHPLFDVAVIVQNIETRNLTGQQKSDVLSMFKYEKASSSTAMFDLVFNFTESAEDILVSITYNSDVYSSDLIEQLGTHLQQLTKSVLETPGLPISQLDFLTTQERVTLVESFNNTDVKYDEKATLITLFSEQAQRTPDAVAAVYKDRSLTYRELNEQSNQFANYLKKKHKIKQADLVAVCLDRSDWMLITILGILKVGAAFVPVDPAYPEERINYMLRDSNCKMLIDEQALAVFRFQKDKYEQQDLKMKIRINDLAYVIYTSGSTGEPKGVMIEHGAIANTIRSQQSIFDVHAGYRHLQFASSSFDASVSEIFVALCSGGSLYIIPEEEKKDPGSVKKFIDEHHIDIATIPPAYLQLLEASDLKTLKRLVTAGEAAVKNKVSGFSSFGDYYNAYGPTETSICATVFKNPQGNTVESSRVPIGRPIANTRIYILNQNGQPCAKGVAGEICVSGRGIARGYLNREELTAEKFVADPFRKGYRMYKTGDVGRWQENGQLEFLGRKDEQIKLRGYRIEPGEIENLLQKHENVLQAVVMVRENTAGTQELVAYVVKRSDVLNLAELRSYASKWLPVYMLPHHYVEMAELPLNRNGKVDKSKLPAVEGNALTGAVEYIAPRTEAEIAVVSVYEEVLRKKQVGIKDDFFVLGGDSIKSIQVVSRLKQRGYSLSIQDVLLYPIVEDLSLHVKTAVRYIDQSTVTGTIPLSPVQHMFFERYPQNNHHYNQSLLLYSARPVSEIALRACLGKLVEHHDALREVFYRTEQGWMQNSKGLEQGYGFEEITVENDEQYKSHCDLVQSTMNLEQGPLFKVVLFHCKDGDRLLLVAHHLVVDGVSWRVLLEDLSKLYQQHTAGAALSLPLKTDSFRYWQNKQLLYAASPSLQAEDAYWSKVDSEIVKSLPLDHAQGSNHVKDTAGASFTLSEELTSQLQTKCYTAYHTEINDILLTALVRSLQKVFGLDRALLNMEGHGRENISEGMDITRTVGWFTTSYPVVINIHREEDLASQLVEVKETLHRVPDKGIGYGILRYLSGKTYTSEPQIGFNYLGDFGSGVNTENGEELFQYSDDYRGNDIGPDMNRGVVLDVSGMIAGGKLRMSVAYSEQQYQSPTITKLITAYREELEKLIGWLSQQEQQYITPSDLTFRGLSLDEVAVLNKDGNVEDVYELSPLQEGLYYHWMSAKDSSSYFMQTSFRIRGSLNIDLLRQSYERLVARYRVLRSHFTQDHGILLQVVKKHADVAFEYIDTSNDQSERSINRYKENDREKGFDLSSGSQMRLTILYAGDDTYEFIWSHHHILMDGWGGSILINEFFAIYDSLLEGKDAQLNPVKDYAAYIKWLRGIDKSASLAYWHQYLDGFEQGNRMWEPKRERGFENTGYTPLKREFDLPLPLVSAIKNTTAGMGITESTFVQVAWAMLMGRYTGSSDVVFGSVVSGRPADLEGVEEMIGLFSNTVPVRISWNEELQVDELLRRSQQQWIAGSRHHYVQLAEVQAQTMAGRELFNQVMVVENYPVQEMLQQSTAGSGGLAFLSADIFDQTNYDFTLTVRPGGDRLQLRIDCNGNLYSEEQIENLQQHFIRLAEQMISNPSVSIKELKLLSQEERDELTNLFNDTVASYDESATIVGLFEQQAAQTPDATAVVFEGRSMTYKQLNELSNQLGHYLRKKYAINREDFVSICLDRNEWMIVSILGILKAGAGYVPIDVRYPQERIDYMNSDSGCKAVIDEKELTLFLESKDEYSKENLPLVSQPSDVAYVIYTSGTTGNPKGVMIEHRNVVRLLKTDKPLFDFSSSDVWTMFHSYCFDFSVWEMYGALLFGGKLVVIPLAVAQDPAAYLQVLRTEGVTVLNQTPSSFYQVITQELQQPQKDLALRYVIFGGEALSPARLWEWKNRYPDTKLINMYGITETTVHVTYKEITDEEIATDSSSIGRPIPTLSCYVLDKHQELVPVGVAGELYVGGAGVGRGYLNREELTAQRFIESPFKKGERLYRSGDRARVLQNGELEYSGRLDEQVKIRGYRIELGEIESAIRQYEGVESVAVIASAKEEGDRELIAYVVGKDISKQSLRAHLQDKLPSYMVPGYIIEMEVLPLTSNGKLDRKRLPQPSGNDIESEKEYIAPRTTTEEKLAEIWSEVLGIEKEKISVKDNFFELGGHSLKAIQLTAKINHAFATQVSIQTIFIEATLENIAERIAFLLDQNRQRENKDNMISLDL